ncbi:formylglycine-generating enzyme family protein [uncultured Paraglaciecola sp.]|uniref:formylglycine-generating enzyme family protein n=1 Tax=uncultured Paraglaciecola sp. TaxID=1765024 RepID=UPI002592FB3A|nr:formylglycine-generating enzyme family protein [uncultured Paraglaciecola sp.]
MKIILCLMGFWFSFTSNGAQSVIEPDMVVIPAGAFKMGGVNGNEQPKHKVSLRSFKLSKYETTVKEFRQFVEATDYKTSNKCWIWQEVTKDHNWGINMHEGNWKTPKYAPSDNHPVMCVTWEDAKAYAKWLSKKTNKAYRLPSEAEWEYAARAGSNTDYYFGNDSSKLCEYGNILDLSGSKAIKRDYKVIKDGVACDDGAEYTNAVGKYKPNAYGIYDMIGNVGEYTLDCEHPNYNGAPTDGSAWIDDCNKGAPIPMIIRRGGAYGANAKAVRTSNRAHAGKTNPSILGEGFRLVEDIISN